MDTSTHIEQQLASNDTINGKTLSDSELTRLNKLNDLFTHTSMGGKHVIVSRGYDGRNSQTYQFENLPEFKNRFLHEPPIAGLNAGDAWLKWHAKNYCEDGVVFCPDKTKCLDSQFNLYRGFVKTPKQGDVSLFLDHITNVICNGDVRSSNYVLQFFAHLLQKPDEKPSVAIVMKSVEGTGKGALMTPLMEILGEYGIQTNGSNLVTGRFNSTLANKLLVFADEVDLTERKTADKLKALISETTMNIERKGIDPVPVANYGRFIFASNMERVLNAGSRERRYLVLEPNPALAQNKDYFDNYFAWVKHGGAAYLMEYLLNLDISEFNPRQAPVTEALIEEKLNNLSIPMAFMYEELQKDAPFRGYARATPQDLINMLSDFAALRGEKPSIETWRSSLGKMMQTLDIQSVGRRGRDLHYNLCNIDNVRASFAAKLGHKPEELFS
ncbi:primase-helicase family protein [Alishewanella sp. d11]|uniref:primase-helicase family protein n=1 Tax=Alishewanella sp. d11 TaxID=3414030 RepID=UPI003BF7B919